jgi:hypothetical protein
MNALTRPRSTCWIQLASGVGVDLMTPDLAPVRLSDLATALARLPRWLGHTTVLYSVGQHSLHVEDLVRRAGGTLAQRRAALLHDAHESLLGDVPSPMKPLLGDAFAALEERLQHAVLSRFRVAPEAAGCAMVRRADLVALSTERRDLLRPSVWSWSWTPPAPDAARILVHPESRVFAQFMQRAALLELPS